jgi:hypothetical protein
MFDASTLAARVKSSFGKLLLLPLIEQNRRAEIDRPTAFPGVRRTSGQCRVR